MIYLDSSVALARIFAEPRRPRATFWTEPMSSSALLEYEVWNRVHAHGLAAKLGHDAPRYWQDPP